LIDLPVRPGAVGEHARPPLVFLTSERDHRDVVGLGEGLHRPAERLPASLQQRWGRHRLALMLGEEADHLPAHHQVRRRQGQIDPVQAVDLQ
jgi:hypothetical protein